MLYTAEMSKPTKKRRMPDPNVFAFNVVQRIIARSEDMQKKTGSFPAKGSDGRDYTINVFADIVSGATRGQPNATADGMLELKTSEGDRVNPLGSGNYQVLQTGVILHSDSPDAVE